MQKRPVTAHSVGQMRSTDPLSVAGFLISAAFIKAKFKSLADGSNSGVYQLMSPSSGRRLSLSNVKQHWNDSPASCWFWFLELPPQAEIDGVFGPTGGKGVS